MSADLDKLIGKTIKSAQWCEEFIAFTTEDKYMKFYAEGDCCSTSWIYEVDNIESLLDEVVSNVIEHPTDSYDWSEDKGAVGKTDKYDSLQVYTYDIVTAKGVCTIDFRNDSNGYYGGYLTLTESDNE